MREMSKRKKYGLLLHLGLLPAMVLLLSGLSKPEKLVITRSFPTEPTLVLMNTSRIQSLYQTILALPPLLPADLITQVE